MQFFTIPVIAILAAGTLAMPSKLEARNSESNSLEARADCGQILPACNGGSISGQTNCRCDGQIGACDVWNCPGDMVVSHPSSSRCPHLYSWDNQRHPPSIISLVLEKLLDTF